jgi:hypothetical protein
MISITYVIGASDRRRRFFRDAETIAICSFLPIQFAVRAARDLGLAGRSFAIEDVVLPRHYS